LNVYRPTRLLQEELGNTLSESSVHCLEFANEEDAAAAFAILSSRLSFWLWHVLGDGFHVSAWLFKEIPFNRDSFDPKAFTLLSALGGLLWRKLQDHRFTSLNAGRFTVGFRPLSCNQERDEIDRILAHAARLEGSFVPELKTFVQANAIVDSTDERRLHVAKHFLQTNSNE
jgi:hypothetical protein